jgi:NADH:ubiquinone oxidoreductase subunit F (NADH-binding)
MINEYFFRICDDILMVFDAFVAVQSGLGIVTVLVMVKSTDVIKVIAHLSDFYQHESCGQVNNHGLFVSKKKILYDLVYIMLRRNWLACENDKSIW